jgi:formate dehydrogenase subunit gamma
MSPVEYAPLEPGPAELEPQWSGQALPVSASPPPREGRLLRFLPVERLAHWAHATFFILAFASGLLTWIPSTRIWMAGSRQTVTHLHEGIGVFMIAVPLFLFLVINRRRLASDLHELDLWDADDRVWFSRAVRGYTLLRREMPPQGRFNAGQKANSIIVAATALGFAVTGSLLFAKPHVPAWLVSRALLLHQVLAAAAIALFAGHLLHAFSTGHGRDSLRAMAGGTMSAMVARERHEKWWRRQGG